MKDTGGSEENIRVLPVGVEPMTFRLLVHTLYHRATGESWELRLLNKFKQVLITRQSSPRDTLLFYFKTSLKTLFFNILTHSQERTRVVQKCKNDLWWSKPDSHYFHFRSSTKSQVYTLKFGSQKIPVYFHMGNFGCGDGGWTLAMKINGAKVKRF